MFLVHWSQLEVIQKYAGVFSTGYIPSQLIFGPYHGPLNMALKTRDDKHLDYILEVTYKNGELSWVTDRHLSWAGFLSFAREDEEQNLELFWYDGGFYFRTLRGIVKGEELIVWPSPRLCRRIGIHDAVDRIKVEGILLHENYGKAKLAREKNLDRESTTFWTDFAFLNYLSKKSNPNFQKASDWPVTYQFGTEAYREVPGEFIGNIEYYNVIYECTTKIFLYYQVVAACYDENG